MELDDFKKGRQPDTPSGGTSGPGGNSEAGGIIESFRSHENKQRRKVLYIVTALIALGIIYTPIFVRQNDIMSIGYGLIIAGFLLGAVYLYLAYKPLPGSIYSLPMADFLNKAENKLKFMKFTDWLIVIPLLLVLGTGGGIVFIVRLSRYTANFSLLLVIWVIFFVLLVIFALHVSRKDWQKEHGELLREIHRVKRSIKN
ncbi:MAG TPA: hypothetical protein VHO03_07555 [Ignavibacteriales bacterium]|nr:hypothetical protein [Ignavibacteriales bacterium]